MGAAPSWLCRGQGQGQPHPAGHPGRGERRALSSSPCRCAVNVLHHATALCLHADLAAAPTCFTSPCQAMGRQNFGCDTGNWDWKGLTSQNVTLNGGCSCDGCVRCLMVVVWRCQATSELEHCRARASQIVGANCSLYEPNPLCYSARRVQASGCAAGRCSPCSWMTSATWPTPLAAPAMPCCPPPAACWQPLLWWARATPMHRPSSGARGGYVATLRRTAMAAKAAKSCAAATGRAVIYTGYLRAFPRLDSSPCCLPTHHALQGHV